MRSACLLLLLAGIGQEGAPAGLLESLERDVIRVVERVRPCVATVEVDRTLPLPPVSLSGFLLDAEGTVVTYGAALEGAHRISVRFADGRSFRGTFLGRGPENRVGLLRVPAEGLAQPPLAEGGALRPGSLVVGIGSPYGFQASVFVGCVSGADRSLGGMSGLVQTTVPVNRGNAGGVLANSRGEIVGMLVGPYEESRVLALSVPQPGAGRESPAGFRPAKERQDRGEAGEDRDSGLKVLEDVRGSFPSEGIHFALPIARVREDARSVLEGSGRPPAPGERRRWLGVYLESASDPALRSQLGLEEGRGVVVREVYLGSPAARGGLLSHDVLVSMDDVPIDSAAESLRRRLDGKSPGARVEFEVVRHAARVRVPVALE
ncbi:MAG TPA: trypsin-like peptidase domain-containing protein [Planctomycetota bacterium]|jgi:S1-C subfamily serine protease|nr:trypsin-like peptidase domain-containing protein [Planctomycetota bacterium]